MRSILFVSLIAVSSLAGCAKSESKQAPAAELVEAKVPTVTVDQLDTMLANNEGQAVDANGDGTRHKLGVIPGAVLLTDSEGYVPSELPADKAKSLVFYCANTACSASNEAAAKAILAGYTNVKVLPEGIAGWVKAGKKIQTI